MLSTTQGLQTDAAYFEARYAEAATDQSSIPWASDRPSPALTNWLNAVAPSVVRCGARVAVVGCGLGQDARELINRGYEVTAFDCSETAVHWARQLDPGNAHCYLQCDLFQTPSRWRHRFDLVVEVNTIQSLSPDLHEPAMQAISELLSPHGRLLLICRGTTSRISPDSGPPWPLSEEQVLETTAMAGLEPEGEICCFQDDEDPPVTRIRGVFRRV